MTLSGPRGRFSARVVFGVARPASLRIEIPEGTGLRFLLVTRDGSLRADLPGEDAMFEGPATHDTMNDLFGIDLEPQDLADALLGTPPQTMEATWRFDRDLPAQVILRASRGSKLSLTFEDPEIAPPPARAFEFGSPRGRSLTVREMSDRLGLRR
jgi:hypothetical protein